MERKRTRLTAGRAVHASGRGGGGGGGTGGALMKMQGERRPASITGLPFRELSMINPNMWLLSAPDGAESQ